VIRALLADAAGHGNADRAAARDDISMEDIVPGTSVDDLLAEDA
jgi:hypothetical protein